MNNLTRALPSQPKKQKRFGLLMMMAGMAGFVAGMSYFRLFGKQIDYSGMLLLKLTIAFGFLVFGLCGFGYAVGGKKTGISFAKWWTILLISAAALGYLLRRVR